MKARAALSCLALALARAALVEFELDGEALPIDVSIEGCFSRGGLEAFVAQQHENITMPGCAPPCHCSAVLSQSPSQPPGGDAGLPSAKKLFRLVEAVRELT